MGSARHNCPSLHIQVTEGGIGRLCGMLDQDQVDLIITIWSGSQDLDMTSEFPVLAIEV